MDNEVDYQAVFERVVAYFQREYRGRVDSLTMRDLIDFDLVVDSWDNSYNTMFGTIAHMRPYVELAVHDLRFAPKSETLSAYERNR